MVELQFMAMAARRRFDVSKPWGDTKPCDVFAAFVIPENVWYLIPAVLLLGQHRKWIAMLCPLTTPKKKACYCWEAYRENWELLKRSRDELLHCGCYVRALKRRERAAL